MNPPHLSRLLILPLLLTLNSCASLGLGGGKNNFSITFHLESDRPQGNSTFTDTVGDPPRESLFFLLPLFDHTDVVAFQPFPATDGTYGATFQFDKAGSRRLLTTSASKQGLFIRTLVNGIPVDYLLIDQQITDGRIVIWRGLSEEFLNVLKNRFPLINPS